MMPVRRGAVSTHPNMIGLKRFIRPGLVVSVGAHVAALLLGLPLFAASRPEPPPPDAMVVDIVPPSEIPRFSGTPSELRSSGSQSSSPANSASAAAQPPPRKSATQSPQQAQQRSNPQRDTKEAPARPQSAQPEAAQAEMVHAETAQPEAQNQDQVSEPQPDASQPHAEEASDQPGAAETLAQLAMLGGRLGGGFAAPPVNAAQAGYDYTTAFRERVSSCSALPAGIDPNDKVSVKLRISFNRDGTLASPPRLLEPNASSKQKALLQSATEALERCQPFTMLPPEKYKQWKTFDVFIMPLNFFGG